MLTHKGTQELKTSRLILRQYRISDAVSMYNNYATDERVTKFLTWTPYQCIDDLKTWLTGTIKSYENNNVYHWAMEYNKEVIGAVSVLAFDYHNEKNHCCELGYSLGYDYWNKGFTSEAVNAVIRFLFDEVGIHRISAKHDIENPASGEVMKKCGMLYEGCLKDQYLRHDGTYSDALIYAIINKITY